MKITRYPHFGMVQGKPDIVMSTIREAVSSSHGANSRLDYVDEIGAEPCGDT